MNTEIEKVFLIIHLSSGVLLHVGTFVVFPRYILVDLGLVHCPFLVYVRYKLDFNNRPCRYSGLNISICEKLMPKIIAVELQWRWAGYWELHIHGDLTKTKQKHCQELHRIFEILLITVGHFFRPFHFFRILLSPLN